MYPMASILRLPFPTMALTQICKTSLVTSGSSGSPFAPLLVPPRSAPVVHAADSATTVPWSAGPTRAPGPPPLWGRDRAGGSQEPWPLCEAPTRPTCWHGVEPIRLAAAFSPDPVPHLGVMIHDVSRDRLILMTLVVVAAGVAAYWGPATDEQDHLRDSRT